MLSETKELTAKVIKKYDHLQLMWIRGKGYIVFDSNDKDITLVRFGEEKDKALKDFDLMVFNHLKERYKGII
jgi:hypothetical protein